MLKADNFSEVKNCFYKLLVDQEMFSDDFYRIYQYHYGRFANPYLYIESALIIGCRSGLEILILSKINPNISLHVIDNNLNNREKIKKIKNIHVYEDIDEFLKENQNTTLDLVRVDQTHFSYNDLLRLMQNVTINSLCGEISITDCNPIQLYRVSKQFSKNFFFRVQYYTYTVNGCKIIENLPEVSVIVAAYGVENYIDACINSLVSQTIKNFEIIIVDDGSVDSTGKKADDWAKRFPEIIRVIHKENGGCASARQRGLEEARGEYVAFVDGDDLVERPMYESLYESAALHNSDIAQCGFYEFYTNEPNIYHSTAWGANGQNETSGLVNNTLEYLTLMPSIWRRIYKRQFLKKFNIGFPTHIKRHDDLPFAFLTMSRAQRVSVIPDCYYAYRLNRPGQDVSATDRRLFIHFEIFSWLYSQIRSWASIAIMKQLKLVEIGTHNWILGRLDKNLRQEYFKSAVEGINLRYDSYAEDDDWEKRLLKNC